MKEEDDSRSPGYHFMSIFQASHNLTEKLIVLNYASDFCRQYKAHPIHRYYFAIQTNPGEQFYLFTSLSAWLIKEKCKLNIGSELKPQEIEDPNVTIKSILDAVRLLEQTDGASSFSSSLLSSTQKLKLGYGLEVIKVLTFLADDAIKKNYQTSPSITVRSTINDFPDQDLGVDDSVDNADEMLMVVDDDENENDMGIAFENRDQSIDRDKFYSNADENDDGFGDEDLSGDNLSHPFDYKTSDNGLDQLKTVYQSKEDAEEWKLEVERVLPQLKVVIRPTDYKAGWRSRVQQIHSLQRNMDQYFHDISSNMEKLVDGVSKNMEKIWARENHLENQLETIISEYISLKINLNQITENYKQVSGGLTEKSRQLSTISDELDSLKEEMEERGTAMTDGTPLINLRKSLSKIKQQVGMIDIRIGVTMHTLLRIRLSEIAKETLSKHNVRQGNNSISVF